VRTEQFRALTRRLETTFAGRCARSFITQQGLDRALVLASQAFTALIPLLLLVSALAPADHRDLVSAAIVGRFRLSGDAADAVREVFAHSGSSATGVLSVFLLVLSGVSLTRRMQRMHQQAWSVEPRTGLGSALHAGLGLAALLLGIALLYLARALVQPLPLAPVLQLVVSLLAGFLLWTSLPWLLLDRRVAWRQLAPVGVLTTIGTSVYGVASVIYMPRLLETYSRQYGLFGVTLALVGWLFAVAVIIVAATVVGVEFDRAPTPWARRLRRIFGIEGATADVEPARSRGPVAVPAAAGGTTGRVSSPRSRSAARGGDGQAGR
jgi:membrane protein